MRASFVSSALLAATAFAGDDTAGTTYDGTGVIIKDADGGSSGSEVVQSKLYYTFEQKDEKIKTTNRTVVRSQYGNWDDGVTTTVKSCMQTTDAADSYTCFYYSFQPDGAC